MFTNISLIDDDDDDDLFVKKEKDILTKENNV